VRDVHAGARPIRADIAERLAERVEHGTLTPREVQVVELIATGMRNREIAGALAISEETVQAHVKNILAKLKVPDRTAAVTMAVRRGIIHIR
jgi:DNA-binding NarL/FixJ family response regulator